MRLSARAPFTDDSGVAQLRSLTVTPVGKRRRIVRVLLVLTLVWAGVMLGYTGLGLLVRHQAMPLPRPAGDHPVGRAFYQYTDEARTDPLAPTAGRPRRVAVTVWYPAA